MTNEDLKMLCAFWNVDENEAIRRSVHLCREMIDHAGTGGEVVLRGPRKQGFLAALFRQAPAEHLLFFTPGIDDPL